MMHWSKEDRASFQVFCDVEREADVAADPFWEELNTVEIIPPYELFRPRVIQNRLERRVTRIRFLRTHVSCAHSLVRALTGIMHEFTPADISRYELDLCAGSWATPLVVCGDAASPHAWRTVIDLSPLINGGERLLPDGRSLNRMPIRAIEIFAEEGWTWGGLRSAAAEMRFQAAGV